MGRGDILYGILALMALRLCEMGYIGPHLPFDAITLKNMIEQNSAPRGVDIGKHESRFLTVLAHWIDEVYPNCQSVWLICEAAGRFMRGLDDPNGQELAYELITHFSSDTDGEKPKEDEAAAEAENIVEDTKIETQVKTEDTVRIEEMEVSKLINTVVVCVQEFRPYVQLN
jgi:hypothetical protein